MATIGLKIAQDPNSAESLSLADTLAKGIFGDPEGQMKARALASEVGVRMASRDKLLADTGLVQAKTKTEQDAEDARLRAGPLVGEAGAAAVPMPVPITDQTVLRARAPGTTGYGPQPAIVDPHDQAVHDTLVARERAIGPVLVLGDNPNATAEGINKNYGGTILSAAAANPAIVSGDSLRIAGGLSTGSAPTTSTVWSAGDTSGVDAAAREKILEARGSPQKPDIREYNGGLVNVDPTGATATPVQGAGPLAKAPEHFKDAAGNDIQWDPTTKAWVKAPGAEIAPPEAPKIIMVGDAPYIEQPDGSLRPAPGGPAPTPKLVQVGKDAMIPPSTPDGVYLTPKTDRPTVVAGPYDDLNSPDGRNNKIIRDAMALASQPVDPLRPSPITPQIARDYDQAFIEKFGAKTTVQKLPNTDPAKGPLGVPVDTPVTEYPSIPNFLSPTEMYRRANVSVPPPQPPGPAPVAGQPPVVSAAPNPLSNATVVGAPTGPVQTPTPNDSQSKDRRFAGAAAFANKPLDKIKPNQIPGVLASMLAIPKVSGNGFLANLGRANLPDEDKEWARNALEFTAAVNYEQSGAAVNADEWENAKQIYIPMPLDGPKQLAEKAAARRNWMQNAAKSGWSNDPKGLAEFLTSLDQPAGGPAPTSDDAPAGASQGVKDAWSHLSADAKDRARKRYGAQ